LAALGNGLKVIDVSNPANPVLVGSNDTIGSPYGLAVAGNYVYVVDSKAGLQVIDVSDPANPLRVGGCDTSGFANGVAVAGQYACVADGEWGLAILKLADPVPRIRALGWTTNSFRVSVPTISGKSYTLQHKRSLSQGEWTSLPAVSGTGGPLVLTDPAASDPQQFYRIWEE
jgi:hypothetical protein